MRLRKYIAVLQYIDCLYPYPQFHQLAHQILAQEFASLYEDNKK